jgi:hypothetical protein
VTICYIFIALNRAVSLGSVYDQGKVHCEDVLKYVMLAADAATVASMCPAFAIFREREIFNNICTIIVTNRLVIVRQTVDAKTAPNMR